MSASKDRLNYLSEQGLSDTTIAGLTGIPRSTIGFVRRGERQLSSEYLTPLYNQTRRVAYHELTEDGLPYHQARKFSSRSTQTINETSMEMSMITSQSIRGAITGKLADNDRKGITQSITEIRKAMTDAVMNGYRASHKSFDDFKDYLTKKYDDREEEQEDSGDLAGGWFE